MFTHFLQTKEWQAYEEIESKTTFYKKTDDFSYLAVKNPTKLGAYLNVPYGPSLKSDDKDVKVAKASLKNAIESLKELAKTEDCFFVRLEPTVPFSESELKKHSLVKSHDIDPAHTWLLQLNDKAEEEQAAQLAATLDLVNDHKTHKNQQPADELITGAIAIDLE